MGTVERQAAYYALPEYISDYSVAKKGRMVLTERALKCLYKHRSDRLLEFVSFIFEHKIFHDLYEMAISRGIIPERRIIMHMMEDYHVVEDGSSSTLERRASTVSAWLRWIFDLADVD
ncbi:MAG: hypothetical protein ACLT63_19830 [Bacteroides xylanisolvens]